MRATGGIDPEDTVEVLRLPSAAELLNAERTRRLRSVLAIRDGESVLLVTRGPGVGSPFRLGSVVSVGRDRDAALQLDDVSVSRRHAAIRPTASGYEIVDLGSLNGTYVNGSRVEALQLADGDEIQIGLFKLVFLRGASAGEAPAKTRS